MLEYFAQFKIDIYHINDKKQVVVGGGASSCVCLACMIKTRIGHFDPNSAHVFELPPTLPADGLALGLHGRKHSLHQESARPRR
jgi:hypothetical protein